MNKEKVILDLVQQSGTTYDFREDDEGGDF